MFLLIHLLPSDSRPACRKRNLNTEDVQAPALSERTEWKSKTFPVMFASVGFEAWNQSSDCVHHFLQIKSAMPLRQCERLLGDPFNIEVQFASVAVVESFCSDEREDRLRRDSTHHAVSSRCKLECTSLQRWDRHLT